MDEFLKTQTTGEYTNEFANGISYRFYTMNDGWIAVVEMHPHQGMIPIVQSKDKGHALSYVAMVEPVTVSLNVL